MKNIFSEEKMKELDDHITIPIVVIILISLILSTCILYNQKQKDKDAYAILEQENIALREENLIERAEIEKLNLLIDEKDDVCKKTIDHMQGILDNVNTVIPINKEVK